MHIPLIPPLCLGLDTSFLKEIAKGKLFRLGFFIISTWLVTYKEIF
jgi:hypothetical protein